MNVQQILNKANTYRNSYADSDKVDWIDAILKQIYQEVPHEAVPYSFQTVSGFAYYPLPEDCDLLGIKEVTIETQAGSGKFVKIEYASLDSSKNYSESEEFFTTLERNLVINPSPDNNTEGKLIYLYYNKRPATLSSSDTSATPDLEEDFHELLVLGLKSQIAQARLEFEDASEFDRRFSGLLAQYKRRYRKNYPEYPKTKDMGRMRSKRSRTVD
ncbi:hypothetical protein [Paenibacillus anseongense]|uniref:phage adaptor protein n=1 Tax=Paenibacillus anseongense TaxID=2682845 RepID=UPI002DB69A5B|nr:hypothetical protein [Paenibacillus anseongense]MEC0265132.1 hypothetical protein [Paenibacillus anseongense]